MEPKIKFNHVRVEGLLQAILWGRLKSTAGRGASQPLSKFPENAKELTLSITNEIRSSVRDMQYERYRLVVMVNLGDPAGGTAEVVMASRCLWDHRFDTFAEAAVQTPYIYAVAVVYAIYCE